MATYTIFVVGMEEQKLSLKQLKPKKLQALFNLDFEPTVLHGLNKKLVSFWEEESQTFEDLDVEEVYEVRIPTKKGHQSSHKLPGKIDIQRALFASAAVYEWDPVGYAKGRLHSHDFNEIIVSQGSELQYLVCFTEPELSSHGDRTCVLAFRGTNNFKDVMVDSYILPTTKFEGRVHAGFLHRAEEFPIQPFLQLLKKKKVDRILLCGHSLGGAISHLIALRILEKSKMENINPNAILSIAFGAPMFGDESVSRFVANNFPSKLHTFVNQKDCVPRLLNLSSTATTLSNQANDSIVWAKELFDTIAPLWAPLSAAQMVLNAGASLIEMTKKIQSTNTNIFVPMGEYHILMADMELKSENQPAHTKILLGETQIDSHSLDNHKIVRYHDYLSKSQNFKPLSETLEEENEFGTFVKAREVIIPNIFEPKVTEVVCLFDSSYGVKTTIKGQNLEFFQRAMVSGFMPQTQIRAKRDDLVELFGQLKKDDLLRDNLTATIETHIGRVPGIQVKTVNIPSSVLLTTVAQGEVDIKFFMKVIEIGFTQYLLFNGPYSELKNILLINALISMEKLLLKTTASVLEIELTKISKNGKRPETLALLGKNKTISNMLSQILIYNASDVLLDTQKGAGYYVTLSCLGILMAGGIVATGGVGAAAFGLVQNSLLASLSTQVAAAAVGVGTALTSGVTAANYAGYVTAKITNNYLEALQIFLDEINIEGQKAAEIESKIFVLEKEIYKRWEKLGALHKNTEDILTLSPFIQNGKFNKATQDCQKTLINRIEAICYLHEIRKIIIRSPCIGLVGEQNTGKTTLVKEAFKVEVDQNEIGMNQHTNKATLYQNINLDSGKAGLLRRNSNVTLMDFPGSDSQNDEIRETMDSSGFVASVFIVLVLFRGDINKNIYDLLKRIKDQFNCPILICLNQASRYTKDILKTPEDVVAYRKSFLQPLQEIEIETPGYLKTAESDIMITDWKEDLSELGIRGTEDVKKWIAEKLIALGYEL